MTLVEVLLSVTIFAVIAVSVAGTFFSGLRLWDRVKNVDFVKTSFLLDLEKVSRDMRQAMDIPAIGFEGDSGSFSFPAMEKETLVRVTYYFDPQLGALMRKTQSLASVIDGKAEGSASTLRIFNAQSLSFQYLDHGSDGIEWRDIWKKDNGIAHNIRLQGVVKGEPFTKVIIIAVGQ